MAVFARLTGPTVKALRHYDELALLRPAHVDEWTGYRWCERSQGGIDEWLDVEVGWPIADADPDMSDGIVVRELPSTRAVQHVHRGQYDGLPDVYRAPEPAIRKRGFEPLEYAREHYVGHPNNTMDPADYETRIVWPLST